MKKFYLSLKILKEIYPPYLTLLVFIPIFIGFIIDTELVDSRNIFISLLWIPLFTIPYIIWKRRVIYQFTAVLFFVIGFIELNHWIILKGPITITSLLVISNTNYQEALDFFDLKVSYWLLILIPYIYVFVLSLRKPSANQQSKIRTYIIIGILLISSIFIFENAINGRLIRKGSPQIVKLTYSFIDKIKLYKEAMQEPEPRNIDAERAFKTKQQTFVLILGESLSRRHMSLYRSARKTNPKLEKRTDLILYTDVVSPYSNTLNSVLSMLSQSNLEHYVSVDKSIDIIDVFHSAGFKTYWISNQSPIGIWDNMVTVFAKKSDSFKFVNTASNSSFEATTVSSYDSKLFKPFSAALKENVEKKFIIIHLMGSHSSYAKRYPSEFDHFKGNNSKEQTIAEYDNSVLYNDFVVDSLINILEKNTSSLHNNISSLIYLSDHGENVYDEMDKVGHDYANTLPKANVEVPFVVWLSPAYLLSDTSRSFQIQKNYNHAFVSDDLFHSIMDINNIHSSYFIKERSVFNNKFNHSRKRVLEDGHDYDEKTQ